MKKILAIVLVVLSISGCKSEAELRQIREDYINTHQDMDSRIKDCILNKYICTGMSVEELMVVLDEYESPRNAEFTIRLKIGRIYKDSYGDEAWEFGNTTYYFENNKLVSWITYRTVY